MFSDSVLDKRHWDPWVFDRLLLMLLKTMTEGSGSKLKGRFNSGRSRDTDWHPQQKLGMIVAKRYVEYNLDSSESESLYLHYIQRYN